METKNRNNQVYKGNQSGKAVFPSIENLLPVGKENAISGKDLLKLTGCSSIRDLQCRIAEEREQGAVICSGSQCGYWKPKNRQEIQEFVHNMDARATNILKAVRSAKDVLKIPEGQQDLKVERRKEKREMRMFSLDIVNDDKFLSMPASAQALYFHLGMRAGEYDFVSNPEEIVRKVNCSIDDLETLLRVGYILSFDGEIMVEMGVNE